MGSGIATGTKIIGAMMLLLLVAPREAPIHHVQMLQQG
jgi:hypothetical protein